MIVRSSLHLAAQAACLALLATDVGWSQAAAGTALCGGAALHGVYLHQRISGDLDLYGSPAACHALADYALTRGCKDRDTRSDNPDRRAFVWTAGDGTTICVDLLPYADRASRATEQTFRGPDVAGGNALTVPVRCVPAAVLIADKVDCCTKSSRALPLDYVDLYWAIQAGLATATDVAASYIPYGNDHLPLDASSIAAILANLAAAGEDWERKLMFSGVAHGPEYPDVRDRLAGWLPGLLQSTAAEIEPPAAPSPLASLISASAAPAGAVTESEDIEHNA